MLISLKGSIGYSFPIYRNLEMQLKGGRIYCVLGPNGSGKTTILKSLSGSLPLLSGSVEKDPPAKSLYVPPDPPSIPGMRGGDAALSLLAANERRLLYGEWKREILDRVSNLLRELESDVDLEREFEQFSTGEKMKILLASSIASDAPYLFLDEPNGHLDIGARFSLYRILREEKARKLIVLSLHDIWDASLICDYGILMGKKAVLGPMRIDEILNENLLQELYRVVFKTLYVDDKKILIPMDKIS
ncbi:MAG: ABC transporter ATP-binding protein [Fervidicoccaceae archaeon]